MFIEISVVFFYMITASYIFIIDNSKRKIISLTTLPLISFICISFFSLKSAPDYLFTFRYLGSFSESYYWLYFILLISLIISFTFCNLFILKKNKFRSFNLVDQYSYKYIFYFSSLLSILAFILNIDNVISQLSLGFGFIREYEKVFGSSTIINYFYFLHVVAIFTYVYAVILKKENIKHSKLIVLVLILLPFFHGIKFTVFDAFAPALFIYIIYAKKLNYNYIALIFIVAIGFLYLFFTFARGANDEITWYDAIINYIIPNYYNLGFAIENFGYEKLNDYGVSLFYPTKLPLPKEIDFIITNTEGFQLNYKYNMYTALLAFYRVFGVFSGVAYGFFILLIHFFYSLATKKNSLFFDFVLSLLLVCNFLSFYYWMLFKPKYIWLILFLLITFFIKKKKRHCLH